MGLFRRDGDEGKTRAERSQEQRDEVEDFFRGPGGMIAAGVIILFAILFVISAIAGLI